MSRICVPAQNKDLQIYLGIEPVLGDWFFQVFDGDNDTPVFELDTRSNAEMLETMKIWVDLNDRYAKNVLYYVCMDLDPGNVLY